jgi:hypothetical protein
MDTALAGRLGNRDGGDWGCGQTRARSADSGRGCAGASRASGCAAFRPRTSRQSVADRPLYRSPPTCHGRVAAMPGQAHGGRQAIPPKSTTGDPARRHGGRSAPTPAFDRALQRAQPGSTPQTLSLSRSDPRNQGRGSLTAGDLCSREKLPFPNVCMVVMSHWVNLAARLSPPVGILAGRLYCVRLAHNRTVLSRNRSP